MSQKVKALSLMLACSLLISAAGCEKTAGRSHESDETSEETNTRESVTETSDETASAEESDVTAADPTAEAESSDAELAYNAYMEFAATCAEDFESELLFRFERNFADGKEKWSLIISYPDSNMSEVYEYNGGAVSYVGALDYYDEHGMSYGLFRELPCMIDFYGSSYGDSLAEPVDGRYFGNIEACAADGSMMLISIGDPFILTEEEYNSLEIGDVIDVPPLYTGDEPGMTVTDITEVNGRRDVELDDGAECWFDQGGYTENPTDYILMTSSDNPLWFNPRLVLVDVAADCEITDTFEYLFNDDEQVMYSVWSPDAGSNALLRTAFWFYEVDLSEYTPEVVNGWLPVGGLAYPVVIRNGELTSINIEWR